MGSSTGGYDEAEKLIRQSMAEQRGLEQGAEQGFSPYSQAGVGGLSEFQRALAEGRDPMELLNKYMAAYRESPELQAQIAAGEKAAQRAGAATGMVGSGAEAQAAASRAQALRGADVQNYLNNLMGIRGQYLGGERSLAGMGMQSAEDIMRSRLGLGQQIGEGYGALAKSEIGKASQPGWLGMLGQGAGALGGYLLGGPFGGFLGNYLGSNLFGNQYAPK